MADPDVLLVGRVLAERFYSPHDDGEECTIVAGEVLAALAHAGRLLPPGGESNDEWKVHYTRPEHAMPVEFRQGETGSTDFRAVAEEAARAARGLGMPATVLQRTITVWPDGSRYESPWTEEPADG